MDFWGFFGILKDSLGFWSNLEDFLRFFDDSWWMDCLELNWILMDFLRFFGILWDSLGFWRIFHDLLQHLKDCGFCRFCWFLAIFQRFFGILWDSLGFFGILKDCSRSSTTFEGFFEKSVDIFGLFIAILGDFLGFFHDILGFFKILWDSLGILGCQMIVDNLLQHLKDFSKIQLIFLAFCDDFWQIWNDSLGFFRIF